jgi:purine-nucleoside phosphorylase
LTEIITASHVEEAADVVAGSGACAPHVGVILGSGLSAVADAVDSAVIIPYEAIPHFPTATVAGHPGRLIMGMLEGHPVAVMQGRAHYYEGHSMARVTLPVRVMQQLGVGTLVVTNAAGGLNTSYVAGDVMVIADHVGLFGLAGINPLRGPNLDSFGPRFPDMTTAYDPQLRTLAASVARDKGIRLWEGTYAFLAGPSFETPAEIQLLRMMGVDAVGMSTVPEVIVARHGGTRVLGLSGISNTLPSGEAPLQGGPTVSAQECRPEAEGTTHEDVLAAGRMLVPAIATLLRGVLAAL